MAIMITPASSSWIGVRRAWNGRTAACLAVGWLALASPASSPAGAAEAAWLSPVALVPASDGASLFIAAATANAVIVTDAADGRVTGRFELPGPPTGIAIAADGRRLFVTCESPVNALCVLDARTGRLEACVRTGHTPMSPVPSADGKAVFVCNRFENSISVIDPDAGAEAARVAVVREPVAVALTPDGQLLLVAGHMPQGRIDGEEVAIAVAAVDTASRQVRREIRLLYGSSQGRGICVSPDGRWACVTHLLAHFNLPTTQLERGWMNSNALTLIDVAELRMLNTVLLDDVDHGAAYPWGVAWTRDGGRIVVTHAGTHEVSVIDAPQLIGKLQAMPAALPPGQTVDYTRPSHVAADVPSDMSFLVDLRRRIELPGNGPRAVALIGERAFAGGYFSDDVLAVDLAAERPRPQSYALGERREMSAARRGEMLFNDATICFQKWQSCASCHSSDGRIDGLNWDLLNDGIGNPKNTKSMLWSHRTPPAMSMGVRDTAETAVRAGIHHILFTVQPEDVAWAMDEYLTRLEPMPSPHLESGQLSAAARRGRDLFGDAQVGCATCHPPALFTDMKPYDVGTGGPLDRTGHEFDTPTLVELWRTAPFLHDGSAASLEEVLTSRNAADRHGKTSHLTPSQIADLAQYLLSL